MGDHDVPDMVREGGRDETERVADPGTGIRARDGRVRRRRQCGPPALEYAGGQVNECEYCFEALWISTGYFFT